MKLSIILPIRNGEPFIDSSLGAIQKMARVDDEIIVIDDGSIDGTSEKLMRFEKSDSRFQIVPSGGLGLVASLNLGLSLASNDFAARFDVDDHYASDRLDIQRAALEKNPVAIFSDYECWNHNFSKSLGRIPSAVTPQSTYLSLISSSRTAHPSVIFNVNAAKEVGGYLSEESLAEDLSLWLRMANLGQVISIPIPLLNYRLSSSSVTSENQLKMRVMKNEVLERYPIPQKVFEFVIDNFQMILDEYKSLQDSDRRSLLLLRDLLIYQNKYLSKDIRLRKKLIKYVSSNLFAVVEQTLRMGYEQRLRTNSRTSGPTPNSLEMESISEE